MNDDAVYQKSRVAFITGKRTPTGVCVVNGTASIEHTGTAQAVSGPENAQDSITGV
jgi:hypothetical protein